MVLAAVAVVAVVAAVVLGVVLTSGDGAAGGSDTPAGGSSGLPTAAPAPAPTGDDEARQPGRPEDEARRPRADAVPLTAAARPSADLSVEVVRLEWVRGRTTIPGEAGGNALRVTLSASNEGQEPVSLSGPVVNMFHGPDATPSSFLLEPGSEPFPAEIDGGSTVQAVFVFTMPRRPDDPVVLEVDLDDAVEIVTFEGRPSSLL